jgi:hypothetical protein
MGLLLQEQISCDWSLYASMWLVPVLLESLSLAATSKWIAYDKYSYLTYRLIMSATYISCGVVAMATRHCPHDCSGFISYVLTRVLVAVAVLLNNVCCNGPTSCPSVEWIHDASSYVVLSSILHVIRKWPPPPHVKQALEDLNPVFRFPSTGLGTTSGLHTIHWPGTFLRHSLKALPDLRFLSYSSSRDDSKDTPTNGGIFLLTPKDWISSK